MTAKEYINDNPVSSTQDNITKELLERDLIAFAKIKVREANQLKDDFVNEMREDGESDLRTIRDTDFIPEDLE